ncbi:M61 family metallopeptidase [Marivirga arenosa]|uniref:PDZ domain-containing protein n=1 Tax=Marivirga arenosa TaxID=3059076 RepID=A0AA51ZVS0_9BACT|nr:PDZ domain-containing protein [Marivirga sp. BKB1-2]WNB17638.1 PDZ domain-containing protein [Marivirga sp. BKB1-2]
MIEYRLSQNHPQDPFLNIEIKLNTNSDKLKLKLSNWRPGRYQLGNFSKYLRGFKAYDSNHKPLSFKKTDKNSWEIESDTYSYIIQYQIYTSIIDGGSTFVDEEHWYLNFINCMLYDADNMNQQYKVLLDIPSDWQIACGLQKEGTTLIADNFYQLVDSPALVGARLKHLKYSIDNYNFHLWFRGDFKIDDESKIIKDFKNFSQHQLETMQEFESKDYHFLFQILPEKAYHGVEHLNSTCIVLGPAKEFNSDEFYSNLLGISSHELFHYWNIIRIRPQEMHPYDFDKENYFTTGYVAEGVTTYYGDLFLIRSGVKDLDWYQKELNKLFKRHFENYGRFNYSLAESSYDLWLDGYEAGIPHRKVSIYVKGALIALILDLRIILKSKGEKSLDDVMRLLWNNYYKNDQGYSAEDYLKTAEEVMGEDLSQYSYDYITGTKPIEDELNSLLSEFGFDLTIKKNENLLSRYFGIKTNEDKILNIAPKSIAEKKLRIGDQIISINGIKFDETSELWFESGNPEYVVQVLRNQKIKEVSLKIEDVNYFNSYVIESQKEVSDYQLENRKKWLNLG